MKVDETVGSVERGRDEVLQAESGRSGSLLVTSGLLRTPHEPRPHRPLLSPRPRVRHKLSEIDQWVHAGGAGDDDKKEPSR